jgi:hypothetical protein
LALGIGDVAEYAFYSTTVPRSIPLVQVNFFLGFSSGVFSVISLYGPVYFVRLDEAGEFYLEVVSRFLNVLFIDLNIMTAFRYFYKNPSLHACSNEGSIGHT